MAYTIPKKKTVYNYRYFLPYAPEWGTPDLCRQRLRELLVFCKEARIDAVQFFVNTLPGTYYMPPPDASGQLHWIAWMKEEVAPAVRNAGISYQLNFQMFLGAGSYDLDMRDLYEWEFLVNQHGEETLGCACPLSPAFRTRMGEMLRLWAGTGPDIIWMDDDFRMHNHGCGKTELDFYCYCPRHLDAFARFSGTSYTREELTAELLKPGKPGPVRLQWLDFLGADMAETARWIRDECHSVSPSIRLAQMTSAPDVHAAEGRDWKKFLTGLCDPHPPITRPCSGIYTGTGTAPKAHVLSYRYFTHSIADVEDAFGTGIAEYGTELENTRFTTWCKSVANFAYVLTLSHLVGSPQVTLSINDLDGSPLIEEPTNAPLLRSMKPRLQSLAELDLIRWKPLGALFLNDARSARKVHLKSNAKMGDLGLLREWEDILLQMGIPASYASPEAAADSGRTVILEEYTAWLPSNEQMRTILSGPVLLDGGAAEVLQQRGFGNHLGVKTGPRHTYGVMAETYENGVLPGVTACRIPHRGMKWHQIEPAGATVTGRFTDAKNRFHTGSTVFENSLGGRVAVYASVGPLAMGEFGNPARLRWLHGMLRWISRESFPVLPVIPHHGLTVVRHNGHELLIAFANLGTDSLKQPSFRLGKGIRPEKISLLQPGGGWKNDDRIVPSRSADGTFLTVPCRLAVFDWLIIRAQL